MSEPEQESSPSDSLIQALRQHCEELEALHNSLGQVMMLLDLIRKSGQKKLDKFIEDHATNIKEDDKSKTFTIDLDKRSLWLKLDREVNSVRSAQSLIPRNFIVAFVCTYDSLLGKLIRFILQVKPEILDNSERILKFSELSTFTDIPSAREYLVEKEVESVLRKSHVEQFKWLELKLGTPFNKNLQSWPQFVELTERRNLFVHCDGIVSSQYLSVCAEHKCGIDASVKVGTKLDVPDDYFENAFACLYEIGVKLAHVIWRKILKSEIEKIDTNLIEVTYNLIDRGEYKIAIRILEFFTQPQMNHSQESAQRTLVINLAQAHKWNENEEGCKSALATMDWSASENRFKIAVSVLKEDFEAAYRNMRQLIHDDTFHRVYYKEWPIFRKLRQQPEFLKVYEECYKEPFTIEEKVAAKEKDEKTDEVKNT